jgi:hypothetical protein
VIPATLDNVTQGELQRCENNYKTLNLIITDLGRNVYHRVAHLETAHEIWLKLCNTYEGSSEIKSSRNDTYNRQYQTFSQKLGESPDDCFARFESIISSLRSCDPLAYSDNERAKQLLYVLDDSVWCMKITALEEFADFATLDTEKLFSKLKSHELFRKGRPNHDTSLTSKAFITSTCVSGHIANPTNTTDSSSLKFILSSLAAASGEQYESIPDDEITLLARKFRALHRFHKERRSPRGCFKCSDTTHFIADCPKQKRLNSPSNKYNYNNRNDSNDKGEGKKKYCFRDKKKKLQKMMSQACATLSDLDFSSDNSSSSEEDEKPKCKTDDFIGVCLMGKSLRHIFDFDSDISDDSSPESLSLRVVKLENALCNQDKLLCKIFHENKRLNLELESAPSEIDTLRSAHDDMSAKSCDNYKMIMVNYADMWLVHSNVVSLLDGARLELREFKAHFTLLGACTTCPLLRSDLETAAVEIKDLKHKLDHSSRYTVLSPPCEACVSLKGKLFYATKENTELQQEVTYLTTCLEKTILNEKMIEEDLSRVEESATKSTYRLGIGFERYEKKDEKSAPKFVPSSNYHKEEALKPIKTHYPSNPKPSFNPKREVRKESPKSREKAFVCMFCGHAGHLDEFCFRCKRIEKRHFEYARNSYRDEFLDFPPHSYSHTSPHTSSNALSHFSHGPNHRSYGFGSRENSFVPRRFGYGPHPHYGDRFSRRPGFPAGGSYTHFELRHLDVSCFICRGSCPTWPNGEVQRTVKTTSGRMVKYWIP